MRSSMIGSLRVGLGMTSHRCAGLAELPPKGYGRGERYQGEDAGMGVLMIVLSLATAGVVVDYIAENDLLSAPNQSIALFGTNITVSGVAVTVGQAFDPCSLTSGECNTSYIGKKMAFNGFLRCFS